MNAKVLAQLGVPGHAMKAAQDLCRARARSGLDRAGLESLVTGIVANPGAFADSDDPAVANLAGWLVSRPYRDRDEAAPYRRWGSDIDAASIQQIENACRLPVSVAGALMPDAHVGYGLPIGGVLATEGAVIPYAVGVDIACRVKISVYADLPPSALEDQADRLATAIESETRFGVGASFARKREHGVMDLDWSVSPVTRSMKDRAWSQLGTSGSGNHFVEFGVLEMDRDDLGLAAGRYLALLSHSGSRGTGASVADHYSKVAMSLHRDLPKDLRHLAWLPLDAEAGQEYWAAMELMGRYASANHDCIHREIARALGAEVALSIENHHNFAWREKHLGRDLIVHRKGATPAGEGVLGVIPGTMASPAHVVRGKGHPDSLHSSAHGAGRVMSRTQAHRTLDWSAARAQLAENGVTLLSAGLDEVPAVYKDIGAVMAAQADLVETVARFHPRLVKMAPQGERPED